MQRAVPPDSSPRDSTPYAVTDRPISSAVGRISASIPRLISEYSICRAAMGCTACARLIVFGPISDRPIYLTCPAATISAIAPTVSSIGTSGSSLAGWYRSM